MFCNRKLQKQGFKGHQEGKYKQLHANIDSKLSHFNKSIVQIQQVF